MSLPRIFVGTLACGEAELEQCRSAIAGQHGVKITHHVIAGKPEYEAHNLLWEDWESAKVDHDLMVKVDADTVLNRPTALAEIFALFANPEVTGAQILLHDYFTDRLIAGLNSFSPVVTFQKSSRRLFADLADRNHNIVLKGDAVKHLAPIGWHCLAPHPKQAFHYGLHRALKKQDAVIRDCANAWLQYRDEARMWALFGASLHGHKELRKNFDYGDDAFERNFRAKSDIVEIETATMSYVRRVLDDERNKFWRKVFRWR